MNNILRMNLDSFILFIVCFFLYTGYYFGLELIISLGLKEYSRYYSVPVRVFVTVLVVIYIVKKIKMRYTYRSALLIYMLLLFFIQYMAMVLLNLYDQVYMLNKVEYIFYLISWSIVVFLAFFYFGYKNIDKIITYFIFSGLLISITSFFLYKDFFLSGGGRISQMTYEGNDEFVSPLVLSYAAVFNFIVYFSYIKDYKNKTKLLSYSSLMMMVLSIPMFILGASRGAFVACIVGFLYIIVYSKIKTKLAYLIILPIVFYVIYLITIKTGNNAFERFFSIQADIESNSTSAVRLDIWKTAWEYFLDSPLFGGYLEVDGIYPHNIFFEVLMNTGLFGALLFLSPLLYLIWYSIFYVNIKKGYFIPLVLILGLSMHLFSGSIYVAPILFLALGLIMSLLNNSEKSTDKLSV